MDEVTIHELGGVWDDSRDSPLPLFQSDDPHCKFGSYVIEPGERVPSEGTTAHQGDEVSVLLSGELDLITEESRRTVEKESMVVIPAGIPHYSENNGKQPARLVYAISGGL